MKSSLSFFIEALEGVVLWALSKILHQYTILGVHFLMFRAHKV